MNLAFFWLLFYIAISKSISYQTNLSKKCMFTGKFKLRKLYHNNYNVVPSLEGSNLKFASSLSLLSALLLIPSKSIGQVDIYPIVGSDDIMSPKSHGTSNLPVQSKLKYNCNVELADKICNYNRHWAENAGYFIYGTSFMQDIKNLPLPVIFYDSVTGVPLFKAPIDRTLNSFLSESTIHGWPSFRDNEVIWDNVRSLSDGEMVSLTGTHLGHNLPDRKGNRYCINLVSIAGYPKND